ncbi:hypothetical protein Vi05172_g9954 [Venturia inaequalis]|nr:hypothetical protein Vi05172_g9954 [Venturia inaequalis]
MVRGWSKQAVTLSAIAIRFAVASLATTATAMIAALAIETRGVPIDDLAQVSIARFSNNGPETFWISGLFNKTFLGIRLRVPLLLLLCTAVASQFTSTLLLSDFDRGLVTGFANQETILLATSPTIISTTVEDAELNFTTKDSYWSRYPKQFAAFAEYTEPGDSSDGVEDTGVTLRSFLPFSDQNDRASLLEFNGVAPVFDTRCLCVRPTFTSLLFDVTGPGDSGTMIGQISYANKIPGMPAPFVYNLTAEALGANVTDQILPTNFSCELRAWKPRERTICILKGQSSILEYLPGHEWPGGLAWVNDGLVSALDPIFDQTERGKSSWMPSPNTGNAYLIVESPSRPGVFLKAQPAPGPWSAVTLRNTTNNFDCSICWSDLTKPNCTHCVEISFRTSLCFDAFVSSMSIGDEYYPLFQDLNVSMSSSATRTEPTLVYNSTLKHFNTNMIAKQLGVGKEQHGYEERGILRLDGDRLMNIIKSARERWWGPNSTSDASININRWIMLQATTYWTPLVAFSSARSYTVANPNKVVYDIFNNTIQDTDSPAKALQAVLTVLLGSAYYDPLPFTNYNSKAWTVKTEFALIPIGSGGLIIVLVISCVHLLLVILVAADFASRSQISLLSNVWQAVAQIAENPVAAEILERADMMTDKEVSKEVKAGADPMRKGRVLIKIK